MCIIITQLILLGTVNAVLELVESLLLGRQPLVAGVALHKNLLLPVIRVQFNFSEVLRRVEGLLRELVELVLVVHPHVEVGLRYRTFLPC